MNHIAKKNLLWDGRRQCIIYKKIIFFGALILLACQLSAQSFQPDADWRFENFSGQSHSTGRSVSGLVLDKHGYIWMAARGIQKFDGFAYTYYSSITAGGTLKDDYTSVSEDKNGRIWVSSAGLCYYDELTDKFIYVQPDHKEPLKYAFAFAFQKNNLWFVSNLGLAKLDLNTLKISFTSLINITDPEETFCIDDHTLWVTSREKIFIYNIDKDQYVSYTPLYNHRIISLTSLLKTSDHLYLGTTSGLFVMKNSNKFDLPAKPLCDLPIYDMAFHPADSAHRYILLATNGKGLSVFDVRTNKLTTTYIHDDNNPYSLLNNNINKLYTDKQKRLWIATTAGISFLDLDNQAWKMRFINKHDSESHAIFNIARDVTDTTKVWMSSVKNGMLRIDWNTKKTVETLDPDKVFKHIDDFIQVDKQRMLVIDLTSVIDWDIAKKKYSVLQISSVPDSIRANIFFFKILKADSGNYYITSNHGLYQYNISTRLLTVALRNGDPARYASFTNGFFKEGKLWLAKGADGLFKYDIKSQTGTVYNDKVNCIFHNLTDGHNGLIICTGVKGFATFSTKTFKFDHISQITDLFEPDCNSALVIKNDVWLSTVAGVILYDLGTRKSMKLQSENLLMETYPRSPITSVGHELVIGFRDGYASFSTSLKNTKLPSVPIIKSFQVNDVSNAAAIIKPQEVSFLSHTNNNVNISFTAFLYTDPGSIAFRYRLIGIDSAWKYTMDQRSANYLQLPPGNYTFNVQSGNRGQWNKQSAAISFIIRPPYWETWWFILVILGIINVVGFILYQYRINQLLRVERMRNKIATDLHDDIGSVLSSISIFSEVADQQLRQQLDHEQTRHIIGHISNNSRAMLDAMDDIVWAVNPKNDHFNDLAIRMHEFAVPLFEAKNITFTIDIQPEILETRLTMDVRKNIFMIFKECINNILKHAGASLVAVTATKVNNQFKLVIEDDGCGFDVSGNSNRNGLKNLNKRAAEINGYVKIVAHPGKGTHVILIIDII